MSTTLPEPGARSSLARIALRAGAITGAAMAAQLPAIFIVAWPLALADALRILFDNLVAYGPMALGVALAVEHAEHHAVAPAWQRHGRLLAALVASLLIGMLAYRFTSTQSGVNLGLAATRASLELHTLWFGMVLIGFATVYLLQRGDSLAAEQRLRALTHQGLEARRRLRIAHETARAARLDPQLLFDCLARAQAEYPRDIEHADSLLDRLTAFLRMTLSGTRSAASTLGREADLVATYTSLTAARGAPDCVCEITPALRGAELPPGLLLPLSQRWLTALPDPAHAALKLHADVADDSIARLQILISGPLLPPETLLPECRSKLLDLYGEDASVAVHATTNDALELLITLPLEPGHAP